MSDAARLDRLDDDDLEVLRLFAEGLTAEAAARRLDCSARTFRRRMRQVCDRLDVTSPVEAAVLAARHRLL